MTKQYNFPKFEFDFTDTRKYRNFALGIEIGRNKSTDCITGKTYEQGSDGAMYQTGINIKEFTINEYYLAIELGFWQLSFQIVTKL